MKITREQVLEMANRDTNDIISIDAWVHYAADMRAMLRALAEQMKETPRVEVTEAMAEKALDAFYGDEGWRKLYGGEEWKPVGCMRAALDAALTQENSNV